MITARSRAKRLACALLALALTTPLASFAGCDEEPLTPDATTPADPGDVAGADEVQDTAAPSEPIPCSALAGNWQLSVCEEAAGAVLFTMGHCTLTINSLTPTILWGNGTLENGRTLNMTLMTSTRGELQCAAAAQRAVFSGTCEGPLGQCQIVGVKSL